VEVPRIRPEQVSVFERLAVADFEARAVTHLRAKLPELTAEFSDAGLVERVRACIPRAAGYGLQSQQQIMCYVDTSFLLGSPEFDTDPRHHWAGHVLRSDKLAPGEKASVLLATACNVYNGGGQAG
jgi:hypothetical protein